MIVVEHQPGALLVGIVKGLGPWTGIIHVGDVHNADAPRVIISLSRRGNPLMGCAVTDPGGAASVEMDGSPVLRESAYLLTRRIRIRRIRIGLGYRIIINLIGSRPHDRGVHRNEEVARGACGKTVDKLDAHRPILLGDDQGAQILRGPRPAGMVDLPISSEFGTAGRGRACFNADYRRQVRMHLLAVLD